VVQSRADCIDLLVVNKDGTGLRNLSENWPYSLDSPSWARPE